MGDPVATEDSATVDVVGVAVASGRVVGTIDDSAMMANGAAVSAEGAVRTAVGSAVTVGGAVGTTGGALVTTCDAAVAAEEATS